VSIFKKKLSVAKFGGSLIDLDGKGIPKILRQIHELRVKSDIGPIAVFSAPMGCTDELIRLGEAYAQSTPVPVDSVFGVYRRLATSYVKGKYLEPCMNEISAFRSSYAQSAVFCEQAILLATSRHVFSHWEVNLQPLF
jgi:aspartokinase